MLRETEPHCVSYRSRNIILTVALIACIGGALAIWLTKRNDSALTNSNTDSHIASWLDQAQGLCDSDQGESARQAIVNASVVCGDMSRAHQAIRDWFSGDPNDAWAGAAARCISLGQLDRAEIAIKQVRNRQQNRRLKTKLREAKEDRQRPDTSFLINEAKTLLIVQGAALVKDFDQASELAKTIVDDKLRSQARLDLQTIRSAHKNGPGLLEDTVDDPDSAVRYYVAHLARTGSYQQAMQIAQSAKDPAEQALQGAMAMDARQAHPDSFDASQVQTVLDAASQPAQSPQQWNTLHRAVELVAMHSADNGKLDLAKRALKRLEQMLESPHKDDKKLLSLQLYQVRVLSAGKDYVALTKLLTQQEIGDESRKKIVRILAVEAPNLVTRAVEGGDSPASQAKLLTLAVIRRVLVSQ